MSDLDVSFLPWSHPSVFSSILLFTGSSRTILACRSVCKGWRNWFERHKIWTKYLKLRKSKMDEDLGKHSEADCFQKQVSKYRIERLLDCVGNKTLTEQESLLLSIKIEKSLRQLNASLNPKISKDTFRHVRELLELELELDNIENSGIMSLGPIALFVRIKVENPLVVRILTKLLNKFLTSIVVDKAQKDNSKLKLYVWRSMSGQNWVFRHFSPPSAPSQAEVFSSLQEASEYLQEPGEPSKRKREDDDTEEKKKKRKVEEEEEGSEYSNIPEQTNPQFPTVRELLDIDHPIIEEALKSRFNIDKILVVPRLEDFILNQDKYPQDLIQKGLEVIGSDQDGNVSKVDLEKDFFVSDTAEVGYMDNIESFDVVQDQLVYWGGRDIKDRWSAFSRQLKEFESGPREDKVKRRGIMNLPVLSSQPSTSSTSWENVDSIHAILAARGISVTRK